MAQVKGPIKTPTNPNKTIAISNPTKPWVFWYWMQASVSKEGITTDLEAMKQNGITGAYLMPIKGVANPPLMEPPVLQLSPLFWEMVKFAMQEANRLGLQLGMHFSDGFALGGGPWITPEKSMQKLVWSQQEMIGGQLIKTKLEQPESYQGYYKDIAVFAFPSASFTGQNTATIVPTVTTSKGDTAAFLVQPGNKTAYRSNEPCWIQYAFNEPFTCRSINIRTNGNNYQAQRVLLQASNDGVNFKDLQRLEPPRHGWQDTDADFTYSIEPVSAKYFRFVFDKTGSEPGSEDLDAAKWKAGLKLVGLTLDGKPQINHIEAKSAQVWRVASRTTAAHVADSICVPLNSIINISDKMDTAGNLLWQAPAGRWTILRMGHTSTGHTNATGGGGAGLECDKFNPETVRFQFDNWFGEAIRQVGPTLADSVLKVFHVDSWECGSQNWSPVFRQAFIKRRGYDLLPYLPVMAGIPVQNAETSERFLYDLRQTIAELVNDNFYATLRQLSHEKGCIFTAESIAPTMVSDGLQHYSYTDVPMGEYWLNSPTHDKPNDMLDAISGAHIYGKNIVQAEAFTTVRMAWNEHPGMMKTLQDRNYAMGINRLVYHVFAHNPWPQHKPGMTLDGVGLYFQPNQTWWKMGKAWVDYAERCQRLLQRGKPVADIAVFTGEEIPRRSILPDRLVPTLPGIFGAEKVAAEKERLANKGEPTIEMPAGVFSSANTPLPQDWVNPLRGYHYDCINPDALLRLATVKKGRIILPGGASYGVLVIPGSHAMQPHANRMSVAVAAKLLQLVKDGACIIMQQRPNLSLGLTDAAKQDTLASIMQELWFNASEGAVTSKKLGKGTVLYGAYTDSSFDKINISRDIEIRSADNQLKQGIAWSHRKDGDADIYFIANQHDTATTVKISMRAAGRMPEIYNPVTNETAIASEWQINAGRTSLPLRLEPHQSLFILLQKKTSLTAKYVGKNWPLLETVKTVDSPWKLAFDKAYGGPEDTILISQLTDWTEHANTAIRYYSGVATYSNVFSWEKEKTTGKIWLSLGNVANMASVTVNGIDCGTAWTYPYQVDISKAIQIGNNKLVINVANTWANRLIGDQHLPVEKRVTNTMAPFRLAGKPLQAAGLLGPVTILADRKP